MVCAGPAQLWGEALAQNQGYDAVSPRQAGAAAVQRTKVTGSAAVWAARAPEAAAAGR